MMAKEQNALDAAGPVARRLYSNVLDAAKGIGPFREEIKKTSVHLTRGSAFLGIHPRKQHLLITIKAEKPMKSPRIVRAEQVSKNRWHVELKIADEKEIDGELLGWMRQAYDLCQ